MSARLHRCVPGLVAALLAAGAGCAGAPSDGDGDSTAMGGGDPSAGGSGGEVMNGGGQGQGGEGGTSADPDPEPDPDPPLTPDGGTPQQNPDAQTAALPPPRAGALASAPCGTGLAKPDGPQLITVNGKTRRFQVRVPTTYDGRYPFPVIFAFHGANESSDQWDRGLFFRKDLGEHAVLALPDAYDPTMQSIKSSWSRDVPDDIAFFDAVVAWLKTHACFDTTRIFATGHSSGASFTNILGCQRGDVLRGIAPVAGGLKNATNCKGEVAAWVAHGDEDPMVLPSSGMQARDFWLERNGCTKSGPTPTETPSCVAYSGCKAGHPVNWVFGPSSQNCD
jgi:polyhydroxybutyrate depolymerase